MELFYQFKCDKLEFKDISYGSKISFEMDACGHFAVKGKIYGVHMTHSLEFEFDADQTVLPEFINGLKKF